MGIQYKTAKVQTTCIFQLGCRSRNCSLDHGYGMDTWEPDRSIGDAKKKPIYSQERKFVTHSVVYRGILTFVQGEKKQIANLLLAEMHVKGMKRDRARMKFVRLRGKSTADY